MKNMWKYSVRADFYCIYLCIYGPFFTLTQNHIKKNILLKRLTNQSQHNKIAYKPNPSHK